MIYDDQRPYRQTLTEVLDEIWLLLLFNEIRSDTLVQYAFS